MKRNTTFLATVVGRRDEKKKSDMTLLELKISNGKRFTAGAGQFILLEPKVNSDIEYRPFTIVDLKNNVITLLIKKVGANTEAYAKMKRGETIEVLGPQGLKFAVNKKIKNYILVGGGSGSASLPMIAEELVKKKKNVDVLLGAANVHQLTGVNFFKRLRLNVETITDKHGYVTVLLEKALKKAAGKKDGTMVVACGRVEMLKEVAKICKKYKVPGQASLETRMSCGMGSCFGCSIKVGRKMKRVCRDGLFFDMHLVNWNKLLPPALSNGTKESRPMPKKIDMSIKLGNMVLEYPFLNASGTLSLETVEEGLVDCSKIGAFVPKSIDLKGKPGNPQPRTWKTPSGMINSIGVENEGLRKFIRVYLPRWERFGKPVIPSFAGGTYEEFDEIAEGLDDTDVEAIEQNISCINILEKGKPLFAAYPKTAAKAVRAVRQRTRKFLIVKLSPNVTDIVAVATKVRDEGADAFSLINTVRAMDIDVETHLPTVGNVIGGMSGPCIYPIGLVQVFLLYQANLGLPIIGMGGIWDSETAAKYFMAGSTAVAVGTRNFSDRNAFREIPDGMEDILRRQGYPSIKEFTGSMRRR